MAEVERRAEAAVDVRGGEDEAAAPAERGDLLDRRGALVGVELVRGGHALNLAAGDHYSGPVTVA